MKISASENLVKIQMVITHRGLWALRHALEAYNSDVGNDLLAMIERAADSGRVPNKRSEDIDIMQEWG